MDIIKIDRDRIERNRKDWTERNERFNQNLFIFLNRTIRKRKRYFLIYLCNLYLRNLMPFIIYSVYSYYIYNFISINKIKRPPVSNFCSFCSFSSIFVCNMLLSFCSCSYFFCKFVYSLFVVRSTANHKNASNDLLYPSNRNLRDNL